MIFSSIEFIFIFLPITFSMFFLLNRYERVYAEWWLVLTSLIFYWYGSPSYFFLFCTSIVFNYAFGSLLNILYEKKRYWGSRVILAIGILSNIALLGYYKYTDFFIENINYFTKNDIPLKHIILPIGISFFTFQLIAYLVDSYRGETVGYNFLNYLLFITFFPQLIVGPIVHHKEVIPQFESIKTNFDYKDISIGIFLFFLGCSKKLLIADSITPLAQVAFDHVSAINMVEAWVAAIGYTVSYYFDLSGYADMAVGLGLMFNIKLPINFNSPYKARNFADYWRRWHITLSRFLGDYVFRTVKKKGGSSFNFYYAIFLTFLISGFWHGAGWTFVVWGVLNGVFVILSHLMDKSRIKLPYILSWILTFSGIVITRVLFVSYNFGDAFTVITTAFDLDKFELSPSDFITYKQLFYITLGLIVALFFPNSNELSAKFKPNIKYAILTIILVLITLYNIDKVGDFLYFQF